MKKIIFTIFSFVVLTAFSASASAVRAEGEPPIVVTFQSTPLFSEANFLPGNTVTRTITVKNNTGGAWPVYVESINESDEAGFASNIHFEIRKGANIFFDDTLRDFFDSGLVLLSTLAGGESVTYSLGATFVEEAGNELQEKQLGFDLRIGFFNGQGETPPEVPENPYDPAPEDDPEAETNSENDSGQSGPPLNPPAGQFISVSSGGGSGEGGRGEGGGSAAGNIRATTLIITNETASGIDYERGIASITWDTNLRSTTAVVYGPASTTYALDLDAPNFGYPSGTVEDATLVLNHGLTLTGLVSGTYKVRVVSRTTPGGSPTISREWTFALGEFAAGTQTAIEDSPAFGDAQISYQNQSQTADTPNDDVVEEAFPNSNLAAVTLGLPSGLFTERKCILYALFLWVLSLLVLAGHKKLILRIEKVYTKKRRILFLSGVVVAVIAVHILFSEFCALWPYIVLAVLTLLYFWVRPQNPKN
ncbi:MAG: hypothetical protein A2928_02165 [Candidatus Taylorbacteria bacterium RIFCSPLOWO2_01_FULL_45_15b]|uniref:Cohesin domain-containing protein n=1 Tax=Candidatus Taylorbacteria bacterium RIFCSPLOWO2_01_FULL_45_15b TaxID=1802319 RepID=A0A1G2N9D7_9BACT|nr:MAG: hypothetical protein A2928_02165 [Candidatus Taylorbacteria bacterium RIFCSPLOWO2_01_FULL_45_15b]